MGIEGPVSKRLTSMKDLLGRTFLLRRAKCQEKYLYPSRSALMLTVMQAGHLLGLAPRPSEISLQLNRTLGQAWGVEGLPCIHKI